jgi:capsular exopolysaccharide synthesis family protein
VTTNDSLTAIAETETEEVSLPPKKKSFIRMYLRFLLRKSWLLVSITLLTTTTAVVLSSSKSSTYKGNFYLLVEPITAAGRLTNPSTLTRTGGIPQEDLIALDYPTNLIFLQSPSMTRRIAEDVHKKLPNRSVDAIWSDLRDNFFVEWVKSPSDGATKIFIVSYSGEDPQEVQAVLDIASQTFVKYSAEDRETSIKAGVKFIDKQLPPLQTTLNSLKNKQKQIREQYELVNPASRNDELLQQLDALNQRQSVLKDQLTSLKTLASTLGAQLGISSEDALVLASLNQDPERISLQKELLDIQSQLANNQSIYTEKSVRIIALETRSQIIQNLLKKRTNGLLKQFSSTISDNSPILSSFQDPTRLKLIEQFIDTTNQIKSLESQLPSLILQEEKLNAIIQKLPTITNQYTALEREIKLTEDVLDKLLIQRETLKVESAQELPWQLVSKPQIPLDADGKPIGYPPDRKKILIAGVGGGLIFSILLSLLLEKQKNAFLSANDIEDILGLPLIGKVPRYQSVDMENIALVIPETSETSEKLEALQKLETSEELETSETQGKESLELETSDTQDKKILNEPPLQDNWPIFATVFDDIYTELCFYYRNPSLRSLAISSVQAEDGQSTIAVNLAITAAEQGKRVLLVDTNRNNSKISEWLNLTEQKGLNYLLTHDVPLESVIQEDPNHKNLYLITNGAEDTNPPKRLWSPKMEYLISEFQDNFDLVIYDLPHFHQTTDVYFLSACTDGMLLVVGVNKTSQSSAKEALAKAEDLQFPILGAIANFV